MVVRIGCKGVVALGGGPRRNRNVCRDVAGGIVAAAVDCLATGENAAFVWNGRSGYGSGWNGPAWNGDGWNGAGWNDTGSVKAGD